VQGAGEGLQFAAQGGFPLLQQQVRHDETGAVQNRAHHQQRVLLVDNYNRRHAEGMALKEVIRAGSLQRLNAILMTALTSALGTLPLVLAFGA